MRLKEPISTLKPSEVKMEGCAKKSTPKKSEKKTTKKATSKKSTKKTVKMEQLRMKLN